MSPVPLPVSTMMLTSGQLFVKPGCTSPPLPNFKHFNCRQTFPMHGVYSRAEFNGNTKGNSCAFAQDRYPIDSTESSLNDDTCEPRSTSEYVRLGTLLDIPSSVAQPMVAKCNSSCMSNQTCSPLAQSPLSLFLSSGVSVASDRVSSSPIPSPDLQCCPSVSPIPNEPQEVGYSCDDVFADDDDCIVVKSDSDDLDSFSDNFQKVSDQLLSRRFAFAKANMQFHFVDVDNPDDLESGSLVASSPTQSANSCSSISIVPNSNEEQNEGKAVSGTTSISGTEKLQEKPTESVAPLSSACGSQSRRQSTLIVSNPEVDGCALETTEAVQHRSQPEERSWYSRFLGWIDQARKKRPPEKDCIQENIAEGNTAEPKADDSGDTSAENTKTFADRVKQFNQCPRHSETAATHDVEQKHVAPAMSHERPTPVAGPPLATNKQTNRRHLFALLRQEIDAQGRNLASIKHRLMQGMFTSPDDAKVNQEAEFDASSAQADLSNLNGTLFCPSAAVSLATPSRNISRVSNSATDVDEELADTVCALHDKLKQKRQLLRSTQQTSAVSCPTKYYAHSKQSRIFRLATGSDPDAVPLCNSWPTNGSKVYDCVDEEDLDEIFGANSNDFPNNSERSNIRQQFGECAISFDELHLESCILQSNHWQIFRGDWHGDVMVHKFIDPVVSEDGSSESGSDLVRRFWAKAAELSCIRHEHLTLFMGASFDLPNLALVMSVRSLDQTLYDKLHTQRCKLPTSASIHIARQVAEAMSYLHAKRVVVGHLCSRNILLDNKVKLSLIDLSIASHELTAGARCDSSYVPPGLLSYLAPELLRRIRPACALSCQAGEAGIAKEAGQSADTSLGRAKPKSDEQLEQLEQLELLELLELLCDGQLYCDHPLTQETDVYAFGSLLYELLQGAFPFARASTDVIIWQVGSGKRQSLKQVACTAILKDLIEDCWSQDPLARPEFLDISRELQINAGLWKKHSSSEPENMHKIGVATRIVL